MKLFHTENVRGIFNFVEIISIRQVNFFVCFWNRSCAILIDETKSQYQTHDFGSLLYSEPGPPMITMKCYHWLTD